MTTETILHRLHENARIRPNAPAYYEKIGDAWVPTSWREYTNQVRQAAKALIALGFQPGDSVNILGFNRPEWVIFDLAGMLAGGHATGIYTTNSPHEVEYIVHHSEASFVLAENEEQWAKINQVRNELPHLKHVVMMRGTKIDDPLAIDWEGFLAKGNDTSDEDVDARLSNLGWEQLATLIYTSGTTGPPKGVMLSHKNLSFTAKSAQELLNINPSDRVVSYLPLSHIAEQMFTIHAAITGGYQVYFAQYPPQQYLNDNMKEAQPTIPFGVPRIWERFASVVQAKLAESTGAKAKIGQWALGVGWEASQVKHRGQELTGSLALKHKIANKLVFSKIQEGLGLGQARAAISAAAPIAPEIIQFFNSVDIPLFELYGQSEGSGPTTTNLPWANKVGSVGRMWPQSQVVLAEDGEILAKGDHIFLGYYKDEVATNETLIDGWLHSGDLGQFDEDGYLTIVGRKKEIIITSGGKNIAPKNIEAALKNLPMVSQAVVIGEKRRFLTALITLDPEAAAHFAKEHGLDVNTLHDNPKLKEALQQGIDQHVNPLFARVEQVRDFRVLPRDFTVDDGELTPTLKIKRRIVNENFADQIEAMYKE